MRRHFSAAVFLAFLAPLAAQQAKNAPHKVSDVVRAMKSPDLDKRERAFDEASELMASQNIGVAGIDALRLGVIQLLVAENARNNVSIEDAMKHAEEQRAKLGDGCNDGTDNCAADDEDDEDPPEVKYMRRLIASVGGFRDERAIPALAGAVEWGDDVKYALLEFGDKALEPVVDQLNSRNSSRRMLALDTAIAILEARNDAAERIRIAELISSSLNDPIPIVRTNVVRRVDCLKSRQDLVPLLQRVAKTDPFLLPADGPADDGGDGGKFYPVRADARRALRHIQNNEPCTAP